ncbi:MAG: A/G-specific adenine glycosylase [Planctomycetaceae bacterium]|nr:A/G-specific adenine glycosylase [Planctomycetaceae bacterium]
MDLAAAFSADKLSILRRNLRRWYGKHGRHLPWRAAGDPYRVWISEIMLQQTTVTAVIPYYERFLARFPDLQTLAEAPEQEVLRLWEGLGYYSRARNIHKTARKLCHERGGNFPRHLDELLALPGIGRYTAGAIASFAFNQSAPIVEANTLRLYCRLLGYEGDPRSTEGQRLLWEFAERLVPSQKPGEFNQALMDLGATVCTPTEPKCPSCPLRSICHAFQQGRQHEIPRLVKRVAMTEVTEASVAVRKQGTFLLRQRRDEERWAGMWDFPRFEFDDDLNKATLSRLAQSLRKLTGIEARELQRVETIRHTVTRYRITLHCLSAEFVSGRLLCKDSPMKWISPRQFEDLALSMTARKFARLLTKGTNQ